MGRLLVGVVSATVFLTGAVASAAAEDAPIQTRNTAVVAGSEASGGLEEIVVTAQRRQESIERAALSIEAASAEKIERAGVYRPEDISKIATGVNVGTGGNFPQFYIRGVGNYGTNNYSEGAIAVNVDDVYVSRGWVVRGSFFDLDRIEVLKGPQGTLYGRNASGGAVNVISAKPRLGDTFGYVEGDVGNYSLFNGIAAINVPVSDTIAIRASGRVVSRDGYLRDGFDDEKSQAARVHILYQSNSDLSVLLTGFYQHDGGKGAGATLYTYDHPWNGPTDPRVARIVLANTQPPGFLINIPTTEGFNDGTVYGVSAEMNWSLGPATLTLIPAYRHGEHSNSFYEGNYQIIEYETDEQTSVELRLANQTDKLKWVAGGYFFNEDQANQGGHYLRLVQAGISGELVAPLSSNIRSYAGFGEATYSLTDTLRATAGLRYTHETKDQSGVDTSYNAPNPACPAGYGFVPDSPVPFAPCAEAIQLSGGLSNNSVTWKAGLEHDLTPTSLLYATVSTGFKSGGLYPAPPPNSFKPEKLMAFELGSKSRLLGNQLQLNLEAFYWRYVDHQESYLGPTSVPGYFTFITANAGRARSYGGMVDIQYQPTNHDRFGVGAQYNKTQYDVYSYTFPTAYFGPPATGCAVSGVPSFTNPFQTISCAGFQLLRTPTWTGNASYEHTFPLPDGGKLTAAAQAQFSSGYYTVVDFLPGEYQPGFALLDANLTYTPANGKWSVAAWGRNLTDRAVFTSSFRSPFINNALTGPNGYIVGNLRPPRTYGVRVHVNF